MGGINEETGLKNMCKAFLREHMKKGQYTSEAKFPHEGKAMG